VLQAAISFRPGPTLVDSLEVGLIRAAFADYWEAIMGQPVPIRELQLALEPPIQIGTVLEFSKLNYALTHEETEATLAELVDHLVRRTKNLHPSSQLNLFDTESEGQELSPQRVLPVGATVRGLQELLAIGAKFPTIYADPPWSYDNKASRAAAVNHYPTMTLDEILKEPVRELADDNAHLHLWTTNGFLREAFAVIDAWGFEFKSCLVWVKDAIGMGNYWRVSHEFLLLGVRGSLTFRDRSISSWVKAHRTVHSRKPDLVRTLVERVSPGPYLEMYGREELPESAWTVYGNQVEKRLF
jgi:N6-adenosine-specific RNA methylase IME4